MPKLSSPKGSKVEARGGRDAGAGEGAAGIGRAQCAAQKLSNELNGTPFGSNTSHGSRKTSPVKERHTMPIAVRAVFTSLSRTIEMGSYKWLKNTPCAPRSCTNLARAGPDSAARNFKSREPAAMRSASKDFKDESSHQREHRPGWNWPSSSGA